MKKFIFVLFSICLLLFTSVFSGKLPFIQQKIIKEKISWGLNKQRDRILKTVNDPENKKKIYDCFNQAKSKSYVSESGVYLNWNEIFSKFDSAKNNNFFSTVALQAMIDVIILVDQMDIPIALLLAENALMQLPENFKQLKNIKYLNLENNNFEKFPIEICKISSLEELIFAGNKMDSVSFEIIELKKLRILDLSNNKFIRFPIWIFLLNELEEIHLASNKLTEISASFHYQIDIKTCKKLKILNLNKNKIEKFDFNMDHFPAIEEIWLLGNPIENLSNLGLFKKNKNDKKINIYFAQKKILNTQVQLCYASGEFDSEPIENTLSTTSKNLSSSSWQDLISGEIY